MRVRNFLRCFRFPSFLCVPRSTAVAKFWAAEDAAYQRELAKLKAMELDGTILVRAEWHGFGEQMPPARSETLFQANAQERNRVEYTPQERVDLLQEQRAVDVNDPRYEDLLKGLQLMKNDYLDRLLALDAKF